MNTQNLTIYITVSTSIKMTQNNILILMMNPVNFSCYIILVIFVIRMAKIVLLNTIHIFCVILIFVYYFLFVQIVYLCMQISTHIISTHTNLM